MASEQKERDAVYNAKYYAAHRVAQQQQQQQQAAMMASAAQTAKTASQADMSGNNALAQVMGRVLPQQVPAAS
jgi:hypothetical protein